MKVKRNWLKRLYHYWLKSLEYRLSNRYYDGLEDLPVLNWWKLHETEDLKWLVKNGKKTNLFAVKRFKKIKSDFIDEFGIDKRFSKYLDKIWELELIKIDIAITGDRSQTIFANMLEVEIEDLLNEKEIKVHNHGVMHVEKFVGFKLNTKETTVYEFYSYIKEIEKQLKHAKENGI